MTERFDLDPTGNWTAFDQDNNGNGTWDLKQSRTHDKANQTTDITEDPGTAWITPVHDAAGNMTTVPKPASLANGLPCTFDAWNRLAAVEVSQYLVLRSEYDGLNRRTMKCQDYDVTQVYEYFYHNSSWQVLENRGPSSSNEPEELGASDQYVWSARYVDAPVLREYGGTRYYYLGDANFNVTTLVDVNGDAREHYQYEPYGKVTILNGATPDTDGAEWTADPNNISDVYNQILYTGRRYDPETGLYYYRNRYYHAELGRFLSRDPIGYGGGVDLYAYVMNRPVVAVDPHGLYGDDADGPQKCNKKDCDECGLTGLHPLKPWWERSNTLKGIYMKLTKRSVIGGRKFRKGCKPKITCCENTKGDCASCANKHEYGFYLPGTRKVMICAQNNYKGVPKHGKCDHLYETLAHELTHLLDECTSFGNRKRGECDLCICDEYRAVMLSGQCQPGTVYYTVKGFKTKMECILRSVHDSCVRECRKKWENYTHEQEMGYVAKLVPRCQTHK